MPSGSHDSGDRERLSNLTALRWFLFIIALLCVVGLSNVYSATIYMNMENGISPYFHVGRHVLYLGVGLIAALICYRLPLSFLQNKRTIALLAVVIIICLIFVAIGGTVVNGARRWISLGNAGSFQPSELAKVVAVLWAASYLADLLRKKKMVSFLGGMVHWMLGRPFHGKRYQWPDIFEGYLPLIVPGIFSLFVIFQPDMGTAALILVFPVLLYVFCGASWSDVFWSGLVAFAGLLLVAWAEPYRRERLQVMFDPFAYASDQGYQVVQSLIAVGSGGLKGQGAGEGLSKFLYLPEQYTDFAFAVLAQEWGFAGTSIILGLFAAVLIIGFRMAGRIPRVYPALLVYGLTMLITVEGFLNIAMVIGIFPVTGVPLPFISFGGTALVTNCCAVGLIANAVKYGERAAAEDERKRKLEVLAGKPVSLRKVSGAVFQPPGNRNW